MSVSIASNVAAAGLQQIAASVMRQNAEGQKQVMETLFADAKQPVQAAAGAGKGTVVDTTA